MTGHFRFFKIPVFSCVVCLAKTFLWWMRRRKTSPTHYFSKDSRKGPYYSLASLIPNLSISIKNSHAHFSKVWELIGWPITGRADPRSYISSHLESDRIDHIENPFFEKKLIRESAWPYKYFYSYFTFLKIAYDESL